MVAPDGAALPWGAAAQPEPATGVQTDLPLQLGLQPGHARLEVLWELETEGAEEPTIRKVCVRKSLLREAVGGARLALAPLLAWGCERQAVAAASDCGDDDGGQRRLPPTLPPADALTMQVWWGALLVRRLEGEDGAEDGLGRRVYELEYDANSDLGFAAAERRRVTFDEERESAGIEWVGSGEP